ncbi:MAG: aminotransferase class V-fold PLP-dependent enzyme [Bacteroidales bacterium]|nr:aminotransferase class V-fold PLP-dependent enzyme [Bacteroidales bacterium]
MDLTALRLHFPVTRRWAFLDHAAVCPIPDVAVAAFEDYARRSAENGIAGWPHWSDQVAEVRRSAARLINAPAVEDIAFIPNTTTGIGLIAEGFPWQPGDNVVLAAEEYPSNQYPWLNLASRGVEVRTVPSRGHRLEIADIRAAMTDRTRVLAISFVEFASGFRNDLDALGELCRERDVFFFVDAIQGLGAFPLDVRQTPIDALAADGHKWMFGPEGAGIVYVRCEQIERLRPLMVGAHSTVNPHEYSVIDFRLQPHAGRYEGGSPNLPGILALGASLELILDVGIATIRDRILALTDYLCERATSKGWKVFSSRLPGEASGIVSLTREGENPVAVMKRCRAAGVIVNARGGRVRVSPHVYNTEAEIDAFLESAG